MQPQWLDVMTWHQDRVYLKTEQNSRSQPQPARLYYRLFTTSLCKPRPTIPRRTAYKGVAKQYPADQRPRIGLQRASTAGAQSRSRLP